MNLISYKKFFNDSQYINEFEDFLSSVIYTERNPLNSELFFLWSLIRSTKPDLFIESGTYKGYSANFICEALDQNENEPEFISFGFNLNNCLSYASKRLSKYKFAKVIEGDARELIKNFEYETRPTAFFIDGPKGRNMPPLFFNILERFEIILFIAVHDCELESGSGNRWYVTNFFGNEFEYIFCDNNFQEQFRFLDNNLYDRPDMNYWKPYNIMGCHQYSYGTQTCFIIPKIQVYRLIRIYCSIRRHLMFRMYPNLISKVKRITGTKDQTKGCG